MIIRILLRSITQKITLIYRTKYCFDMMCIVDNAI